MSARYRVNASLYKENTRPRQLQGYLAYAGLDGALERVADSVTTLRARRAFESLVPEAVHGECDIILFRDGELSLYPRHNAAATWLRNRQQRLIAGFREKRIEIKQIRLCVSPAARPVGKRPVTPPQSPPKGASEVVRQGANCVSDPGLKEALDRLAKRLAEREMP